MGDWDKIEGFLSLHDANVIASYIKDIGDSGWIVEIGCFKGRQSAFIAENKKESTVLSCIDPFPDKLIHFDDSRTYRNYMFFEWQDNVKSFANVEAVRSISPFNISFLGFSKSPDLVIFDVDAVFDSLVFWDKFSNHKTKFIVHTYKNEHDRITQQIAEFVNLCGYSIEMFGALAVLEKKV